VRANMTPKRSRRPRRTRRLRLGEGMHFVIDGPFTETKEVVAGYWSLLACTECQRTSSGESERRGARDDCLR
jgi:hypothetical protein